MHIRYLLLLVLALCWAHSAGAQSNAVAAPGTYQLLTTEPKMGEVFTTDLLVFIEAHRRPSETVQCQVGQVTWVRIFSYDEINDPDFQPVPEGIIAVSPKYIAGMVTRQ